MYYEFNINNQDGVGVASDGSGAISWRTTLPYQKAMDLELARLTELNDGELPLEVNPFLMGGMFLPKKITEKKYLASVAKMDEYKDQRDTIDAEMQWVTTEEMASFILADGGDKTLLGYTFKAAYRLFDNDERTEKELKELSTSTVYRLIKYGTPDSQKAFIGSVGIDMNNPDIVSISEGIY